MPCLDCEPVPGGGLSPAPCWSRSCPPVAASLICFGRSALATASNARPRRSCRCRQSRRRRRDKHRRWRSLWASSQQSANVKIAAACLVPIRPKAPNAAETTAGSSATNRMWAFSTRTAFASLRCRSSRSRRPVAGRGVSRRRRGGPRRPPDRECLPGRTGRRRSASRRAAGRPRRESRPWCRPRPAAGTPWPSRRLVALGFFSISTSSAGVRAMISLELLWAGQRRRPAARRCIAAVGQRRDSPLQFHSDMSRRIGMMISRLFSSSLCIRISHSRFGIRHVQIRHGSRSAATASGWPRRRR